MIIVALLAFYGGGFLGVLVLLTAFVLSTRDKRKGASRTGPDGQ
jgi:hypothetical protein